MTDPGDECAGVWVDVHVFNQLEKLEWHSPT